MEIKRMNIAEFREKGYLQEVNRRFFHPLGLALEVIVEENGEEKLGGIWDYREDPEGIYYDIKNSDLDRQKRFDKNAKFIDSELENRCEQRKATLGFGIEPTNA